MSAETAAERPVDTLLSGPAAGVIGAAHLGQRSGFSKLVGLDIGGTSADISIIDQEFGYTTETRVGDFPIITPAVEVTSIGAGGGSIAWVDQHGVLKVGPESAGADPGPACYGRGGNRPTVTDAYVANGWIDPEQFLAGTLKLQTHLGTRALSELGSGIGLDATELADAILTVTTSNMYAHIMPLLARAGVDLGEFALLAYGGAGPTHGFSLAKEIGISTVIVPPDPGTLCALGCLVADLRGDFMRTVLRGCAELTQGQVERWFVELETEADRWLKRQNATVEKVDLLRYAEMRYQGQSFEIEVPMTGVRVDDRELLDLRERFNDTYLRVYKTSDSNVPVEIVNLRVQVVGRTPKPTLKSASVAAERRIQSNQQRSIRIGSQSVKVDVYARTSLQPGDFFSSPCVVEQYDTTSVIPPGFSVSVDALGTMIARQG